MNLVFVNHMHPATPHVSGMRAWYFARELARRGHRVVQICEWREGSEPAPSLERLAQHLEEHDWSEPLLLAVKPQSRWLLNRLRAKHTPAPLRKVLVTWSYFRHSGMFTDFNHAVQPYMTILAQDFRPQATWGLFGNTDCWLIAQRLARLADCPWVADMKDSWEVFIRRTLRVPLARRFRDMAACTANAELNARVVKRWFLPEPIVVYSGVDPCFQELPPAPQEPGRLRLTLTGSIHDVATLQRCVAALARWFATNLPTLPARASAPEVIYAGASSAMVARALRPLEGVAIVRVNGYLPLSGLAALCHSSTANMYIWNPNGFHHKLLELLSCGRPVIAFPGETMESRRLASESGGTLFCPTGEDELMATLDRIIDPMSAVSGPALATSSFSWASQARTLEGVFMRAGEGSVV